MTDLSEIVARRFGPAFKRKCAVKSVVECSYWRCQVADHCQGLGRIEEPTPTSIALLRALQSQEAGNEG